MTLAIDLIKTNNYISGSSNRKNLTFLYTKGKEFFLNGSEYIGEYHIVGSEPFTESEHSTNSIKLTPYYDNIVLYEYDQLKPDSVSKYVSPTNDYIDISDSDRISGKINRYFVTRSNELRGQFFEINIETVSNIGMKNGIDPDLYKLIQFEWYITNNKFNLDYIIQKNTMVVNSIKTNNPGIEDQLIDLTKYSLI